MNGTFSGDTIAAISTPVAAGGIGMVRMSGPQAFEIADQIFVSVSHKTVSETGGYHGLFGRLHDEQGEIDEAVVFVYRIRCGRNLLAWRNLSGTKDLACLHIGRSETSSGRRIYPQSIFKRKDEPDSGRSSGRSDCLSGSAERTGCIECKRRCSLSEDPSCCGQDAGSIGSTGGVD